MDLIQEFFFIDKKVIKPETSGQNFVRMKPSTSKTSSSSQSPPPEEPSAPYVNNNLPDPDDEPTLSDIRGFQSGEEMQRRKSEMAKTKYNMTRPEMIKDQRDVTAQLFNRYTEDEERKRIEQQKNKEAMNASAAPASRNGQVGETRKRRNDVAGQVAEEEWKRTQQHWINQNSMQHGFQMQQHYHQQQQQQYMMHQHQMAAAQQHHGMQIHHNNQMPSTSSADSVRSAATPASMHQPSPAEMRNGSGMSNKRNGMEVCSPINSLDKQDENTLSVPEGEWFDKLAVIVAEQYDADTVLAPETYDQLLNFPEATVQVVPPPNGVAHERLQSVPPTLLPQQQHEHQIQQNKMRIIQQQQQQEMQRMEQQRHHQMMQAQHQQRQMHLQQQHMHQQHHMSSGFQTQAQQQAAYAQMQRMQHLRYQQQQQQQHQQQQHQNGAMGFGLPNGYPQQMHMQLPPAYGHMPQHTPFANIN